MAEATVLDAQEVSRGDSGDMWVYKTEYLFVYKKVWLQEIGGIIMAQRVNAAGQVVEYDKSTQRWVPVKESEPDATPVEETTTDSNAPAPEEDETLVEEGDTTPRRARGYDR